MKRFWMFSLMLATVLGFQAGPALATAIIPTLEILPASQDVPVGDSVEVAITISYLGDFVAPSLGVFDLDLAFDSAVLAFSAVTFGDPVLGDQLDLFGFGSITAFDDTVPGVVNVFELSLDLPSDLDTLQPGSFTLATLSFDTLALGVSALDISIIALGDSLGDSLDANVVGGAVNVVPEPSAALLFAVGGLIVGHTVRKRANA